MSVYPRRGGQAELAEVAGQIYNGEENNMNMYRLRIFIFHCGGGKVARIRDSPILYMTLCCCQPSMINSLMIGLHAV